VNDYTFKVGDPVFVVYSSTFSTDYSDLTQVESISPKRGDIKVVGNNKIFNKLGRSKDKNIYSSSAFLELATPELIEKVKVIKKEKKDYLTVKNLKTYKLSKKGIQLLAEFIRELPKDCFKSNPPIEDALAGE
jgi:hypothetical protein